MNMKEFRGFVIESKYLKDREGEERRRIGDRENERKNSERRKRKNLEKRKKGRAIVSN